MRTHKLGRWNWSDKAKKWVYVEGVKGDRSYKYSKKTPKQFDELTKQLKILNDKLNAEKDDENRNQIFKKMMKLSQKMQSMRK
jgi:hypothetical protein